MRAAWEALVPNRRIQRRRIAVDRERPSRWMTKRRHRVVAASTRAMVDRNLKPHRDVQDAAFELWRHLLDEDRAEGIASHRVPRLSGVGNRA